MLRIVNIEEIEGLLRRIPPLIDRMEQRDTDFVGSVRRWLTSLEQALENNRMPTAGEIAALRGVVASADRGMIPEGIKLSGRLTNRKLREVVAGDVVRRATTIASDVIRNDRARVDESDRIVRQMLAIARAKGLIPTSNNGPGSPEVLKGMWQTLRADSDTAAGAVNTEALIGPHDAIILLDRAIARDARG